MPKESFFKLNPGKQMKIKLAGIQEFTKYPYESASINRIIKTADIARGSFYNYFEGLADLYAYCFMEEKEQMDKLMRQAIFDANGDFAEAIYTFFTKSIELIDYEQANLAFNIINAQAIIQEQAALAKKNFQEPQIDGRAEMLKYIDLDFLKSKDEFLAFEGMLVSLMLEDLKNCVSYKLDKQQAKLEFRKKIEILKYGAYKKN